jgi:hypothetical protein
MAEINTAVTFKPEIDGPSIPTYMMLTGDYLRKLYISKKYGTQIVTWVAAEIDPLCIPKEDMEALINTWTKEAETLYPGEGDHRVKLLDDDGNRIPIGSEVEFIIEENQTALPTCEASVPTCPDRVVVFQICNENSITDDNFDIYLNTVYIGAVDLSAMAQVGSVFIASTDPTLTITSSDFACPIPGMVVYFFDPSLLQISNTIEMRNTQDNGAGNAGTVGIRNYLLTGTDLSAPCIIADLIYGPPNGEDAILNFSYTQCCP